MFLGGDKFKNDISNNKIIKCHECGNTNLRLLGYNRTGNIQTPYKCENGHLTWGALDDQSIIGQTDPLLQEVNDCCCEGTSLNFPESIFVNFNGLIGVQARESLNDKDWGDNSKESQSIYNDIITRSRMPISICGGICDCDITPCNGPWQYLCEHDGDSKCNGYGGDCYETDDFDIGQDYGDGVNLRCDSSQIVDNGDGTFTKYYFGERKSLTSLPPGSYNAHRDASCQGFAAWAEGISVPCDVCTGDASITIVWNNFDFFPGADTAGAPQTIGDGPTFLQRLVNLGSIPPWAPPGFPALRHQYFNSGGSLRFLTTYKYESRLAVQDNGFGVYVPVPNAKCSITVFAKCRIVYRVHPSAGGSATDFFITDASTIGGTNEPVSAFYVPDCVGSSPDCVNSVSLGESFTYSCSVADPDNSNFCTTCGSCATCSGPIETIDCDNDESAMTIWPYRIPYYPSTNDLNFGNSDYQLFRDGISMSKYPTDGECECEENFPNTCGNFFDENKCCKLITYPSCFDAGTEKCSGADARFKIPCSRPSDYFTVNTRDSVSRELLNNRYTVGCGGDASTISFNPIFAGSDTNVSLWKYLDHPNPQCGTADAGFIGGSLFNTLGTECLPSVNKSYIAPWIDGSGNYISPDPGFLCYNDAEQGAGGIRTADLLQVFGGVNDKIQQPHCLRRVKNPNLHDSNILYAVNTADVSNQTLILDRYYKTGNTYDYLWRDRKLAEDNSSNQPYINNKGDLGLSDVENGRLFPYPFTANSGSVEEPELVAIIHSENGEGGQVAFQTFPVSYDTDILLDVEYDGKFTNNKTPDLTINSTCPFKHRVTVHGYGVMYPLIDDPIWNEGANVGPTNKSTGNFTYPVILPGSGYAIGDKIEFRCWKALEDADDRDAVPGEDESIWGEECIETIIATATITELNDERLPPNNVVQIVSDANISVTVIASGINRYYETYKLQSVTIQHTGVGYDIDDIIYIQFNDNDSLDGIHYEITPYVTVTSTGLNGKIETIELTEPGEFYKIIRTGGIRWYEFDEKDENDDYLIFVGNCPCEYDKCKEPLKYDITTGMEKCPEDIDTQECLGCISKTAYPNTHTQTDALPDGFPGFPAEVCTYQQNYRTDIPEIPPGNPCDESGYLPSTCNGPYYISECQENCTATYVYNSNGTSLGALVLNKDRCSDFCFCIYDPDPTPTWYGTTGGDCYCAVQPPYNGSDVFQQNYIGPHSATPGRLCFPYNRTWEFYPQNYARTACSGDPIIEEQRPYMDFTNNYVVPPKKAQWKAQWLPATNTFISQIPDYIELSPLIPQDVQDIIKNQEIDSFLRNNIGCNPLQVDRFNKSYKFPNASSVNSSAPCRKFDSNNPLPTGAITNDNYCRVYGFYQQIQPTCEVIYKGQYIMRAAEKSTNDSNSTLGIKRYTDCEPIIEDITITLSQKEAKFDISVGAPYNQDYLIPENLPQPVVGEDSKLEASADPWNYPSLKGLANTQFHDYGFFEPNRFGYVDYVKIEGESENDLDLIPTFKIYPIFTMPNIDGQDFVNNNDIYLPAVWDLQDPRSNCRNGVEGLSCGDDVINPIYNPPINLPISGLRNSFITDCPYPWEDVNCSNDNCDYYCMFKNNSAEIVLNEIEQCEYCSNSVMITNSGLYVGVGTNSRDYHFGAFFFYTASYLMSVNVGEETTCATYLMFRAYGDSSNNPSIQDFKDIIDDYVDVWTNRTDIDTDQETGKIIYDSLLDDTHQSIFWNMLFTGANNTSSVNNLYKVEVFTYSICLDNPYTFDEFNPPKLINSDNSISLERLFYEDRCNNSNRSGSVKSLTIQNPGKGYAFEIEERVPPSSVQQIIPNGELSVTTVPLDTYRRRETYAISGVEIQHNGTGYAIDQIININFNDSDYRRERIYVTTQPTIRITGVTEEGAITGWKVENSGEFYKYIGTGEHRAYPVSIVLNNYWEKQDGSRRDVGKHAKLRPIVGVDPSDPNTYGTIKKVEVEYGGIDYVAPAKYWTIDTKLGKYNQYGELTSGLDVVHLVDDKKFDIKDVMDYEQLRTYETFISERGFNPEAWYSQGGKYIEMPDQTGTTQNKFEHSIKHYLHTGADNNRNPIRWCDKVKDWSTVIVSGSNPFEASGLLDRTYDMALVEENLMYFMRKPPVGAALELYAGQPIVSNCPSSVCGDIIGTCDKDEIYYPYYTEFNEPCDEDGYYCDTFTAYDAHRYPIDHLGYPFMSDAFATPRPYVRGCSNIPPFRNDEERDRFCTYEQGGVNDPNKFNTNGFGRWPMMSSSNDKCSSAEYSMYLEIAKYLDLSQGPFVLATSRAKTITYKMQDPITMTISFNDTDHEDYIDSLACSGDILTSGICDC